MTKCKYTDKVCLCLGVSDVTPVIDGVEQPQKGRSCKHFIYSGKMLLSMTDFEKKVQFEITQVKGLKGGHTSGWFKVHVVKEDKLYLDDTITKLEILVFQLHVNYTSMVS